MNSTEEIIGKVNKLVYAHKQGFLGGEKMPEEQLRKYLIQYKVALQPNKQPMIWKKYVKRLSIN